MLDKGYQFPWLEVVVHNNTQVWNSTVMYLGINEFNESLLLGLANLTYPTF